MEARIHSPRMGSAALCAALTLCTFNIATAQYASPLMQGHPMNGQPIMGQPGIVQPFVQGMPTRRPAMSGRPNAAMHNPTLPPQAAARQGSAAGQSENFIVLCRDPNLAHAVSREAEKLRRELAIYWLGYELPPWSRRCPLHVISGAQLGAGGETRFSLYNGHVGEWTMSVQGTPERILDSVLPHEITHTIFASHFAPLNAHVPRWADEGACTTVEHDAEQSKHKAYLVSFLRTGRGMSFNRMFSLKDYPEDILPLYAQGHSVVDFLISQGGPRTFVQFLEEGMKSQRWEPAIENHYGYSSLGELQTKWNQWIADGRGAVDKYVGNPSRLPNKASELAGKTSPASPLDLDAVTLAGDDEAVEEGASVALASYSNLVASGSTKPASLAQGDSPAEVNLVAANTAPKASSADETNDTDGYYRHRLESNLRDVVRVHSTAISGEQPAQVNLQARTLDASKQLPAAIYR